MKKIVAFICSALMLSASVGTTVSADTIEENNSKMNNSGAVVYSAGLISSCSLSITKTGNTIYMSGKTECFNSMKSVGFKNIVLQRSTNGVNWTTYATFSDVLNSSSTKCSVTNKNLGTVPVGYYYRVTCSHYAKETGLAGSSESIPNTSNRV